jgi:hypothetical protein
MSIITDLTVNNLPERRRRRHASEYLRKRHGVEAAPARSLSWRSPAAVPNTTFSAESPTTLSTSWTSGLRRGFLAGARPRTAACLTGKNPATHIPPWAGKAPLSNPSPTRRATKRPEVQALTTRGNPAVLTRMAIRPQPRLAASTRPE